MDSSFCLLLVVLLFLDEGNLLPWAFLACALHELGHWLALHLLGGQVAAFRLSVVGAELTPTRPRLFSYAEELSMAAAGPLFSFAAALFGSVILRSLGMQETAFLFAGLNLAAGLFNLLPIGPLDGARMLRAALLRHLRPAEVERICHALTLLFGLGLLMLGLWHLLRLGGNLTLLLCGVWLLFGEGKRGA